MTTFTLINESEAPPRPARKGRRPFPETAAVLALRPGQVVVIKGHPNPEECMRTIARTCRNRGLAVQFWTDLATDGSGERWVYATLKEATS